MGVRQQWALGAALLGVVFGAWAWTSARRAPAAAAGGTCPGPPDPPVTAADLATSLRLGATYLVTKQKPDGTFAYSLDARTGRPSPEDNQVRQAGALWGVALLAGSGDPELQAVAGLGPALQRGLGFFERNARTTAVGRRFPVYPGGAAKAPGSLGTAALVTLAMIEAVKAGDAHWRAPLDGYLAFLLGARTQEGLWHESYDPATGAAGGDHSPYADGEALLALVEAAKYLHQDQLRADVRSAALAGYSHNVVAAGRADRDSELTKGTYQWSSLAFYEMATSAWSGDAPFGDWLLQLADWMVDVHKTLARRRNTGYAYEGLVPALAYARLVHDDRRAAAYDCVVQVGLARLLALQIGHPRAAGLAAHAAPGLEGGVLNGENDPEVRIDVVQHQMHATLLALDLLFRSSASADPAAGRRP